MEAAVCGRRKGFRVAHTSFRDVCGPSAERYKTMNSDDVRQPADSASSGDALVSASVPLATPRQAEQKMTNPWILLKVKALGELLPEAGIQLEEDLDRGEPPRQIAVKLFQNFHVRLSELEVARYGAWLPHLRRDAMRKADEQSERNVQEFRTRKRRQR